jgi:hypothetical protein
MSQLRRTRTVLICKIAGEVNQERLIALREHLRLQRRGRLTDDWDAEFGWRRFEAGDSLVSVELWRDNGGDEIRWYVDVSADAALAATLLASLEREVRDAVTASGLAISDVRYPDPFGPPTEQATTT